MKKVNQLITVEKYDTTNNRHTISYQCPDCSKKIIIFEEPLEKETLYTKEEVETLLQEERKQILLELIAYFSDYNVPLTMNAKEVQKQIIKFMEEQ